MFLSELRPGGGKGPVLMKRIQTLLDCSLFDKNILLALPNETLQRVDNLEYEEKFNTDQMYDRLEITNHAQLKEKG